MATKTEEPTGNPHYVVPPNSGPIKLRTQNDGRNEEFSAASAFSSGPESHTRQEFKDESDINFLLERYGAIPPGRTPQYGVVNFDDDLTTAFEAVQEARAAHARLPKEIRDLYPDWQSLAEEIAKGDADPALGANLETELQAHLQKVAADAAARSAAAAAAASASDSAADSTPKNPVK